MYHSGTQVHLGDSRRVTATPARSSMELAAVHWQAGSNLQGSSSVLTKALSK